MILYRRGQKIILDRDLAVLYGVETRILNQAVKRNAARFPDDFMFKLSREEVGGDITNCDILAQSTPSKITICDLEARRKHQTQAHAFTEQGVVMLSSVFHCERAVKVNIAIMRAFVKLRQTLERNRRLAVKFAELEKRVGKHDEQIGAFLKRRGIGFHVRETSPRYRSRNCE